MPPHAEDINVEYPIAIDKIEIPPKRKVPGGQPNPPPEDEDLYK
jgi:hypothetical protein